MKSLEKSLHEILVAARVCLGHSRNPMTSDHLYCAIMFLSQADRSAIGVRPRSSRTLAMELATQRAKRIRFYRKDVSTTAQRSK
jgi:hypothetical protein